MTVDDLKKALEDLIDEYESRRIAIDPDKQKLSRGKLFEFFTLSVALKHLKALGFDVRLNGAVLDLKQGPSIIKAGDTYFSLVRRGAECLRVYTDVEVQTLGSSLMSSSGKCSYHEVDIVAVTPGTLGRPRHDQLALGIECKSHPKFQKHILKEVLGVKRELSFYVRERVSEIGRFTGHYDRKVRSEPAIEFWLVHADPDAAEYSASPSAFGIEFRNWFPTASP